MFFCVFAAGSFLFNGAIFVSSAAFNNLGYPTYSTVFNWGRSTLGVIPFVWVGAQTWGAKGVVAGWGLGAVVFGIVSVIVCFRVMRTMTGGGPATRRSLFPARPRRRSRRFPPARRRRFSRVGAGSGRAGAGTAIASIQRVLELVLDRHGFGEHGVDLHEIEHAEARDRWAQQDVRLRLVQLGGRDRLHHQLRCAEHQVDRVRPLAVRQLAARRRRRSPTTMSASPSAGRRAPDCRCRRRYRRRRRARPGGKRPGSPPRPPAPNAGRLLSKTVIVWP